MKHKRLLLIAGLLMAIAAPASAACYADYKAKKSSPLQLHYGVMQISGSCTKAAAAAQARARLGANGWTLLNVLSVFDDNGLASKKSAAGAYFLRF